MFLLHVLYTGSVLCFYFEKKKNPKKTYPGCDTPQHNQRTWKSEMGGRRTRKRRFNTGRAPTTGPAPEPPVDWEASAVAAILPSDGSRPVPGENDGAGRRGQLAGRRGSRGEEGGMTRCSLPRA